MWCLSYHICFCDRESLPVQSRHPALRRWLQTCQTELQELYGPLCKVVLPGWFVLTAILARSGKCLRFVVNSGRQWDVGTVEYVKSHVCRIFISNYGPSPRTLFFVWRRGRYCLECLIILMKLLILSTYKLRRAECPPRTGINELSVFLQDARCRGQLCEVDFPDEDKNGVLLVATDQQSSWRIGISMSRRTPRLS